MYLGCRSAISGALLTQLIGIQGHFTMIAFGCSSLGRYAGDILGSQQMYKPMLCGAAF